ncbi:MAG: methionine synthase [Fidelibacterota bacterium]|nr:MAG: methionine synthase [Candidatus Neomarinimicrobiota bacterium]
MPCLNSVPVNTYVSNKTRHTFSKKTNPFLHLLRQRVVVFDGAVGTNLQAQNLTPDDFHGREGCNEILVRSRPDVIRALHASFLEVGCDVVETNTFGGTAVVLAEYGLADEDYALNKEAAALAREVSADYSTPEHPRFVAGSMGPGTKLPSLGHISFKDLHAAYRRQAAGLIDGGADLLSIETCQDLLQTKAALIAIFDEFQIRNLRLPVLAQVTMETTGTMLLGSDMLTAIVTLAPFPIDVLGLNCATGPGDMGAHVRTLSSSWDRAISAIPNAGLPRNVDGKMVYDLTPARLASELQHFVADLGVNVVGGCCGTTPEHLKVVVDQVGGLESRRRTPQLEPSASSLYGTAVFDTDPKPLIIGERTNANGSKQFREYLLAEDLDGMLSVARDQVQEQAHILDVSTAYVGRDETKDLGRFTFLLNTDCPIPVMIDSTEPQAIEAALQNLAGKSIINSINLEDGEARTIQILDLCHRYGAGVVALTIDEEGMAVTADRKLAVAQRLYDLAVNRYGLTPEDIFFDALTFTLGSGDESLRRAAVETLEAIRRIKVELPGVHTLLGVSNVSFGLKPLIRHRLNSVFLHHAIEAGLDAAIVHAGKIRPLYQIPEEERHLLEDLVFDRSKEGYDPLTAVLEYYQIHKVEKAEATVLAELPVKERLKKRIVDGNRIDFAKDLDKALATTNALDIINTVLLEGMKTVGELFAAGEMQLPFVLRSAETMKAAVTYLEPHLEKVSAAGRGKLVIATVKGDVHDIGKNLVDIILTNNGYQVINLGIKQPIETIIESYKQEQADAIGMSGLLVKSTIAMKENLEVLNERGLSPPILLGGAALNRRYVEEDLRNTYKGQLYYAQDAFDGLRLMGKIQGGNEPAHIDEPPRKTAGSQRPRITRRRKAIKPVEPPIPPFWGSRVVTDIPLSKVVPYINRAALFRGQWGMKKRGKTAEAYNRLVSETLEPTLQRLIQRAEQEELLQPAVVYGYFPCNSEGDTVHVYTSPDENAPLLTIDFPRQAEENGRSIADFFLPVGSGRRDLLGAHLVTIGSQATEEARRLFEADEYSEYLYFHGFAAEATEALAEYWHKEIRRELGIDGDDGLDIPSLFRQRYRGCRYSFGYPACPQLEDQDHIFTLLTPERIGVSLTEEWQLVPEQSTSAIIVHHPAAKYFSVRK